MSIFGKIKDAIFGHKGASADPASRPQIPAGMAGGAPAGTQATPSAIGGSSTGGQVDVEQTLGEIAAQNGTSGLNYRTSIVDLMKVLGLDSSLDNRKELATELGYTGATDGSAEMNIWLHKAVMRQLAANGGKVPATMMD